MIRARTAIALQGDGWLLRNSIIWHKPNGMPSSVRDRLTNRYEHLFHFVKSPRYFYDLDAIRVPHRSPHPQRRSHRVAEGRTTHTARHLLGLRQAGKGYIGHPAGSNPGDVILTAANTGIRNKLPYRDNNPHIARLRNGHEAIHPMGKNPGDVLACSPETRALGILVGQKLVTKVPTGKGWIGHPPGGMAQIVASQDPRWLSPGGKNPGDFWAISTRAFRGAHFAVFPEALCELPIKAACPKKVCTRCGMSVPARHEGHLPNGPQRRRLKQLRDAKWTNSPVYYRCCSCRAGTTAGVVFDPFAGAGATLVVAKKLARFYLGSDLNPAYVELARKRLSKTATITGSV